MAGGGKIGGMFNKVVGVGKHGWLGGTALSNNGLLCIAAMFVAEPGEMAEKGCDTRYDSERGVIIVHILDQM